MKTEKWILEISDRKKRNRLLELRQRYEFLAQELFNEYQPTLNSNDENIRQFMLRLNLWLDQFDDVDAQIAAFESIEYFFFAGIDEFHELYRCAAVKIERWLIGRYKLCPFSPKTPEQYDSILKESWICPVTDSFRINDFLHLTKLSEAGLRGDWYTLSSMGDSQEIRNKSKSVKNLILLEDFTGSGVQISSVLRFALNTTDLPILLIPMVACAPAINMISSIMNNYERGRVIFDPIVILEENCLVGPDNNDGEPMLFNRLRTVLESHAVNIGHEKPYGFGDVGCLVSTYSNCPDNTPPLYHTALINHQALFPRLPRNG